MKKLLSIVALFLVFSIADVNAQSVKFGHINTADLLAEMPDVKTADSQLQTFNSQLENQLKQMYEDYQNKMQTYQAQEQMLADAVKQTKEKEIVDLQTRIQEYQMTAQQSLENKKEELYSPILKKAEDAIKAIAKEQGYGYVFDTSPGGGILFAQESDDLMSLVKGKLGL